MFANCIFFFIDYAVSVLYERIEIFVFFILIKNWKTLCLSTAGSYVQYFHFHLQKISYNFYGALILKHLFLLILDLLTIQIRTTET